MKQKAWFIISIIISFVTIYSLWGQSVTAQRIYNINADCMAFEKEENSVSERDRIYPAAEMVRVFEYNPELRSLKANNIGDMLELSFFDDILYTADILNVFTSDVGNTVITAKINQSRFAYIFLVIADNSISISAKIPDKDEYFFASTKGNRTYLYKTKLSDIGADELGCSVCEHPHEFSLIHDTAIPNVSNRLSNRDEVTISLLYVYTPAAALWAVTSPLVTEIDHVIDISLATANLIMENSETGVIFQINYRYETDYIEVNNSSDFMRITNPNDGYMDEVHLYRDTYSADIMVFLADINYTGGTAWLLNSFEGWVAQGWDHYSICINRVQQTATSYTVVHEIGHNMGAHHHREQNFQPGPNDNLGDYTSGWRGLIEGSMRTTVMSYESGTYYADGINATRIPYFSSPLISVDGVVIGDALLYDNARVINETKEVTAAYRGPLLDFDLAAISITGPIRIQVLMPAVFSILVQNQGQNMSSNYNILLMQIDNNIPLDQVIGEALQQGESSEYHLLWLPETEMQTQVYGKIEWELDENNSNNQTSFLDVIVNPAGTFYSENFDTGTNLVSIGWTANLASISGIIAGSGVGGTNGLTMAAYGIITTQSVMTPLIDYIVTNTSISFAYRIVNYSQNWSQPPTAYSLGTGDIVYIEASTTGNYGTFTSLYQITNTNHIPSSDFATITLPLDDYAWQNIYIRFRQYKGTGSWIFVLDDVYITGNTDPIDYLSITPSFGYFDDTIIGQTSPPLVFTIRNFTETVATVSNISLTGSDPTDFNFTLNDNLPWTLPPNGGTKIFTATFAPTTVGSKLAIIEIIDDLTSQNRNLSEISLNGIGLQYATPQNFTYTAEFDQSHPGRYQLRFNWLPPQSGGIGTLIGYRIYRNDASLTPGNLGVNVNTYLDRNIANGNEYTYYVTAVYTDPDGESTPSNIITLVVAPPPINVTATPGNTMVNLEWYVPPPNNNRALSSLTIERQIDISGSWTMIYQITDISTLSYLDNDLINGISYYYRIFAEYTEPNAISVASEIAGPIIPYFWYPPQILSLFLVNNLVILTWQAPIDTGVSVSGYRIYRGTDEDNLVEIHEITSYLNENMAWRDDTGFTPGETYYYALKANYSQPSPGGDSDFSIVAGPVVSIDDETIASIKTELVGNSPNPFNPETTIYFSLSAQADLRIDIYNIKGQKVRSLVNETYPPGNHSILWNGTDNEGYPASTGIYFYKMETEKYVSVKRMMLVK